MSYDKTKNLWIKHMMDACFNVWNKFADTVFRGPLVFQAPLTFFLPGQFDLWGRRLWPDALEPDNTLYEEMTGRFVDQVDSERENDSDSDRAEQSVLTKLNVTKKHRRQKYLLRAHSTGLNQKDKQMVSGENRRLKAELLAKYPEWDSQTLDFVKYTFEVFALTATGVLTKQEFFIMLASFGDTTPRLAVLSQFNRYSHLSPIGEVLTLLGLYEYIYNSTNSLEKPNTILNRTKYHLRGKVKDLADMSMFMHDMTSDEIIHYGYC